MRNRLVVEMMMAIAALLFLSTTVQGSVIYSFNGNDFSPGSSGSISNMQFQYTSPSFLTTVQVVPASQLDYCRTDTGPCTTIQFTFPGVIDSPSYPPTVYPRIEVSAQDSRYGGYTTTYFYFPVGSFQAPGLFSEVYGSVANG